MYLSKCSRYIYIYMYIHEYTYRYVRTNSYLYVYVYRYIYIHIYMYLVNKDACDKVVANDGYAKSQYFNRSGGSPPFISSEGSQIKFLKKCKFICSAQYSMNGKRGKRERTAQ